MEGMQNEEKILGEGLHLAIIMDGNGRWAKRRGLPRTAGHRKGAKAVRRTVEAAADFGIETLTLYAFSSDNWQRPAEEVATLMQLFERYLGSETERCVKHGVRLNVIGRRDRLSSRLVKAIEKAEATTADGTALHLRLAVDYSSRHAIATAASMFRPPGTATPEVFSELLNRAINSEPSAPDVDLLIRTSGEQRLSDFLLWECAYAELVFTSCLWPDFGKAQVEEALSLFQRRERRFGTLPDVAEMAS
jgi:undecaprenyl diphosphate synthase